MSAERVESRTDDELSREWDKLASERDSLISEGRDLSYRHVLLPALRRLGADWLNSAASVLDVGCGTGKFAADLARGNRRLLVHAIDPSALSIDLARRNVARTSNLTFENVSVESFATEPDHHEAFDLVVANMLLQNVSSLVDVLRSCVLTMRPGGALVFAIPHPCFWPRYWDYEKESWFDYGQEIWIKAPFRTSLARDAKLTTTHAHRPLSVYITAFHRVGLAVEELSEPFPDETVKGEYPVAWEYPRFLLGRCRRPAADRPRS